MRRLFTAVAFVLLAAQAKAEDIIKIDQGWSAADTAFWHSASQGSRLLPLDWLRALEQPDSDKPFLAPDYIASFNYIPGEGAAPDLPMGIAIDAQDDSGLSFTKLRWKSVQSDKEPWAGPTCSLCHSNVMTYNGKRIPIEGAPTLADFQSFLGALDAALLRTRDSDEKFSRFAAKVLAGGDVNADKDMLRSALNQLVGWQQTAAAANYTTLRYGFGRLDAIGYTYNKLAMIMRAPGQVYHPSDAPVSYPYMWNVPQLSAVQWDTVAPNGPRIGDLDIGALARNTGESIAVFSDVKIDLYLEALANHGYKSSIQFGNLEKFEKLIEHLSPPAWPAQFPPIDRTKAAAGQKLYAARCERCHQHLDRTDLTTHVTVGTTLLSGPERIGTDPWMACNAYAHTAHTGFMVGTPKGYFALPPFQKIQLLALDAPLLDMFGTAVVGAITHGFARDRELINEPIAQAIFDRKGAAPPPASKPDLKNLAPELDPATIDKSKADQLTRCMTDQSPLLGYKRGPLAGVWATAPYLHNGSAPTLYDLLLPPAERPKSFYTGTREFDPVKVGYKTEKSAENRFLFQTVDEQGHIIQGNANTGHDYDNASLSPADREALIEYLKGL